MAIPFFALAAVAALIPATGLIDGLFITGAASAILAMTLAGIAIATPDVELDRLGRVLPAALIALLAAPALWMIFQILPMPAHTLANDIWSSGSAALKRSLGGAVTIDIGATLLSLAQYCAAAGALIVAAAIAHDRKRAEDILGVLVLAAAFGALWQILVGTGFLRGVSAGAEEPIFIAVAGIIVACAAMIQLHDRRRRSASPRPGVVETILLFSLTAAAFVICSVAILLRDDVDAFFATLLGIGVLAAAFAIHRWRLGAWGKAGLAGVAVITMVFVISMTPAKKDEPRVADGPKSIQTATARMLADAPIAGTGAGTYAALLPIYRDPSSVSGPSATSTSVIAIEMGRGFVGLLIATMLGVSWVLFSRALTRRRDYVFAGAGAATAAAAIVLIFGNSGLFGPSGSLLIGILGGLAFGQSVSSSSLKPNRYVGSSTPPATNGNAPASPFIHRQFWLRGLLALLAVALLGQAVWIFGSEIYAPGRRNLFQHVAFDDVARESAKKAARNAMVRGDLWANSAWAQTTRREDGGGIELIPDARPVSVLGDLIRAVRYAPHRSDAWLLLAVMTDRYKPVGYDAAALLKMSYYTAPNDLELLPLRLGFALSTNISADDSELQEMMQHDVGMVLTGDPALRPILAAAYRSAASEQKRVAERLISKFDPGYLETIRKP